MKTPMRESEIEAYLVKRVELYGGIAYKFTSPQRRNVPDRLVALPKGVLFFVECKATREQPSAGQLREHARLKDRGHTVLVIDSKEQVDNWLRFYTS